MLPLVSVLVATLLAALGQAPAPVPDAGPTAELAFALPQMTGLIEGIGPRYCPSVEDKVVRFAAKASHQIFVEPEGLDTHVVYPNGISTSLPADVQLAFVRTIAGFERAEMTRPGYAIEYDYFCPKGLRDSLETRALAGLFFAG